MSNTLKWDTRFLELAKLVSTWSKDPSTQTGAVLVGSDRKIISVGYNGFPKQLDDAPELYANRDTKYSRIIHCEMNAVLSAGHRVDGATLYTWPFASCDRCCVHMISSGIKTFVFPKLPPELIDRWAASVAKTKAYLDEAGLEWREI